MNKRIYDYLEIKDLKDMLNKTEKLYANRPAYKIKIEEGKYQVYTHKEVRDMIDALGTALINLGLKGKRIAVIGENRYEWEIAYLSIVCGTGIVVPLDKSLPANELELLIERSDIEAIFYTKKYSEIIQNIRLSEKNKLKHLISMDNDENGEGIYSQKELIREGKKLIEEGNNEFLNAKINPKEMEIMLFTSGTTSKSKVVALSHENICTNLMDIGSVLDVNQEDVFLSILPIHHVFECTVGFLYPLSIGGSIIFSKGVRHIADELKNFRITAMICVPVVFEKMYDKLMKTIESKGKLATVKKGIKLSNCLLKVGIDIRKKLFKEIHDNLGGCLRVMVAGGAALSPEKEKGFWDLGFNLLQGYGLTETSPVIAAELTKQKRLGSIGKKFPSVEVKIDNPDKEGVGELLAKGNSVMLGYYNNDEANEEVFTKDGWFCTGDLARIDKNGYIYISGRKKFVIVLKNGKNVYPEEIESLIEKNDLIKECMVFGMPARDGDVTLSVKVCYDKDYVKNKFGDITKEEISKKVWDWVKEVNQTMPKYKYVKKLVLTDEELVKTTTLKIKRNVEMKKIMENN